MLRIERVSKRFGEVRALVDVSCEFASGEVHALLGENGAGKSTLMGVLAGFVVPDSGRATIGPEALPFGRPHEVRSLGVGMVHQHFMLVPEFTVAENFALGTLKGLGGRLDLREVDARLNTVCAELGWEIDPSARTGSLPVGVQQRLEIVKALAGETRVLILDEPTAVLSPSEVEDLFRVVQRLRDEGVCVVLIAHKLSEVLSVADRVTVLRRGAVVASSAVADVDSRILAEWMVGEVPAAVSSAGHSLCDVVCTASDVWVLGDRGEDSVRGVAFEVRQGEVFGIGGVDGNGQDEIAEALVGLRPIARGRVDLAPGTLVGYVPPDRRHEGLALEMSVLENVLVGDDSSLWAGPFLRLAELRSKTDRIVREFDVRVGSVRDPARSMSGGNQQKLLMGRVLSLVAGNASSRALLVVSNPTRGLDVRATAYVQSRLVEAARSGAAVVLFSTDLDELAAVATRTAFMNRGRIVSGGSEEMVG